MELQRRSDQAPIITNGVTQGGPCLWLYPYDDWCEYEARIVGLAPNNLDVQAFNRFMISGAAECPIDNQGRTLLPQYLRDHGRLEREVTFAGVGTRIEVWSTSLFEGDQSRTQAQFPHIAEVVSNLDT